MIIPKLLHGTGVMPFNAKEIGELQVQENAAYRSILDVRRRNTPISELRGGIGSSLMVTRIMESKILFTKSILKGSNNLTKQVLRVSRSEKNNVYKKTLNEYLNKFRRSIHYKSLQWTEAFSRISLVYIPISNYLPVV